MWLQKIWGKSNRGGGGGVHAQWLYEGLESYVKFQNVEDPPKPKLSKESMNQNWNFQRVGGVLDCLQSGFLLKCQQGL